MSQNDVEFIGMIQGQKVSEIHAAKGPAIDRDYVRGFAQAHENAGTVLKKAADASFDLVFLDSERPEYPGWWPDLKRVLRPGGLLVVDNATSHVEQLAPFVAIVAADATFTTSLVPVGNGEFLAVKG